MAERPERPAPGPRAGEAARSPSAEPAGAGEATEAADASAGEPGPDDYARMLELADLLTPQAIRVAVTLGVPTMVAAGALPLVELSRRCAADGDALRSLVTVLAERGLVAFDGVSVGLTRTGRTLLHAHAQRAFDLGSAEAQIDRAYAALLHTVRTGESCYASVHGVGFWEHLAGDAELSASFDSYLADHAVWAPEVAALPLWADADGVVDIGGGDGAALVAILTAHPHLAGTLVELPATIARAEERIAATGLGGRVTLLAGSFFDELPAGGVHLLAHVLHDWPDDESVQILRRVRDAGPRRVVIVEQVVDDPLPTFHQAFGDLRMRVLFASGERTLARWEQLAAAADLQLSAVHRWGGFGSVLELEPVG